MDQVNGLRLTDTEIKKWIQPSNRDETRTYQDLPILSPEQDEFRYKLSLLLFEIFEEIGQHPESWIKCNKFVRAFETEAGFQFQKF